MTVDFGEGDLYARPVDTPDAPWAPVGRGTARLSAAASGDAIVEVGIAVDRFIRSVEATVRLMMTNRQVRSFRRRLLKGAGPRPLAPGCLPASKVARRGWR